LAPFYRGLLAEIEAHGDAEGAEAQAEDAAFPLGGLKRGSKLSVVGRGVGWRSIRLLVAVFPEETGQKPDYDASAGPVVGWPQPPACQDVHVNDALRRFISCCAKGRWRERIWGCARL